MPSFIKESRHPGPWMCGQHLTTWLFGLAISCSPSKINSLKTCRACSVKAQCFIERGSLSVLSLRVLLLSPKHICIFRSKEREIQGDALGGTLWVFMESTHTHTHTQARTGHLFGRHVLSCFLNVMRQVSRCQIYHLYVTSWQRDASLLMPGGVRHSPPHDLYSPSLSLTLHVSPDSSYLPPSLLPRRQRRKSMACSRRGSAK